MPEPLPPVPATTVAPTPASEYRISQVEAKPSPRSSPALRDALNRHAGIAPTPATAEPRSIPSQPPRPTPEPAPEGKPAPSPVAPDDKPAPHVKFIPADDQEPPAPPATAPDAKPTVQIPGEPPPEVVKSAPAQLREAYERLKADFATRAAEGDMTKKQLTEYQAKAKGYEDRIKSLESAETRAKELEKQVLTYDEQLRVANYLQHPEFHEKYVKPVAEATQSAYALVADLMVEQEDGSVRIGSKEDFHEVLSQPNTTLATRKAKELFGQDVAQLVVAAREKVKNAQSAQARAMENASLRSQDWLKEQQEQAATRRTQVRSEFDRVSTALAEKYPQLYRPADGDKEAIAARKSGEELARLIIDGQPEDMPQEAYMNNVAKIYHRAASFPMRELAVQRLQAELESTKARLAAYEKSTPDTSSRQTPGGVTTDAGGAVVTSGTHSDLRSNLHSALERRARGGR